MAAMTEKRKKCLHKQSHDRNKYSGKLNIFEKKGEPMDSSKDNEPVVVFTGHAWEAEMLVNILENEGISAFVNNEVIGTLFPFYTTPGMGAVRVVVSKADEEMAKMRVAIFEKDRFEKD